VNDFLCTGVDFIEFIISSNPFLISVLDVDMSEDSFDIFEELCELPLLLDCLRHRLFSGVVHQGIPSMKKE
jgi:hypothetical protein